MSLHVPQALVCLGARLVTGRVLNPRLPWEVQRRRLDRLVGPWPLPRGTSVTKTVLRGVPVEVVTTDRTSRRRRSGGTGRATEPASAAGAVTVVHFHGGGYCVGSPAEARDWAAHLSALTGCRVVLPGPGGWIRHQPHQRRIIVKRPRHHAGQLLHVSGRHRSEHKCRTLPHATYITSVY